MVRPKPHNQVTRDLLSASDGGGGGGIFSNRELLIKKTFPLQARKGLNVRPYVKLNTRKNFS